MLQLIKSKKELKLVINAAEEQQTLQYTQKTTQGVNNKRKKGQNQ